MYFLWNYKNHQLNTKNYIPGLGLYNIKYCLALALFLIAAIIEPVGYSFVLPAAMCDLDMTDSQRGFIASIPYIGKTLTYLAQYSYTSIIRCKRLLSLPTPVPFLLGDGAIHLISSIIPCFGVRVIDSSRVTMKFIP